MSEFNAEAERFKQAQFRVWTKLTLANLRAERETLADDGRHPNKVHDLTEQIYALGLALNKFDEITGKGE